MCLLCSNCRLVWGCRIHLFSFLFRLSFSDHSFACSVSRISCHPARLAMIPFHTAVSASSKFGIHDKAEDTIADTDCRQDCGRDWRRLKTRLQTRRMAGWKTRLKARLSIRVKARLMTRLKTGLHKTSLEAARQKARKTTNERQRAICKRQQTKQWNGEHLNFESHEAAINTISINGCLV